MFYRFFIDFSSILIPAKPQKHAAPERALQLGEARFTQNAATSSRLLYEEKQKRSEHAPVSEMKQKQREERRGRVKQGESEEENV